MLARLGKIFDALEQRSTRMSHIVSRNSELEGEEGNSSSSDESSQSSETVSFSFNEGYFSDSFDPPRVEDLM
jgi:hypothetical protein